MLQNLETFETSGVRFMNDERIHEGEKPLVVRVLQKDGQFLINKR